MTLEKQIEKLYELYGQRNAMFLRGNVRQIFLLDAMRHLSKLIRKGEIDTHIVSGAVASVFCRLCALADSYIGLPLVEALSRKYPLQGCAYCNSTPYCMCERKRQHKHSIQEVNPRQLQWSIRDWCTHLDEVYGEQNEKDGIEYCLLRLYEEIAEADHAILKYSYEVMSLGRMREYISLECADAFARIFAIAAMLEVDLQSRVEGRYNGNCRRCNQRPCDCPHPALMVERVHHGS